MKKLISEMKPSYQQIWFMPWADLKSELRVGPIIFWPFSSETSSRIKDASIREHLLRYFQCYVDHRGRPVDTIAICSHATVDCRKLNDTEINKTRSAVNALIFSVICPAIKNAVCADNNSMAPPSSERFQLLAQNFQPGSDHVAVGTSSMLSGGWEIGEISFSMPWSLGGPFGTPNEEILQGLSKLYGPGFPTPTKQRILRSFEWFHFAHIESDEVSILSKIVMMATAFEILLNVPNTGNKSGWIADEVAKRCAVAESEKEIRKDRKGKDQTRPKVGWWAWDFYKLRNAVVHGDEITPTQLKFDSPTRDWLTHLIVADLVFWELVTRELYNHGCIGDNLRMCAEKFDKVFPEEAGSSEALLAPWVLGFNGTHKAIGWLSESRNMQ